MSALRSMPKRKLSCLATTRCFPLSHDVRYTLMKPWVKGLDITPLGMLYLENAWLER